MIGWECTGSTISTLLHDRINPKDCQVLFLGDTGFLQFFRVVSRDYGKPRLTKEGAQVNFVDTEGRSALLWAAVHGSVPMAPIGGIVVVVAVIERWNDKMRRISWDVYRVQGK